MKVSSCALLKALTITLYSRAHRHNKVFTQPMIYQWGFLIDFFFFFFAIFIELKIFHKSLTNKISQAVPLSLAETLFSSLQDPEESSGKAQGSCGEDRAQRWVLSRAATKNQTRTVQSKSSEGPEEHLLL